MFGTSQIKVAELPHVCQATRNNA